MNDPFERLETLLENLASESWWEKSKAALTIILTLCGGTLGFALIAMHSRD